LARVGRERLDVAALALGVDRVEGKTGLARTGQACDADQAVPRQANGDVLEVVLAGAVDDELVGSHSESHCTARTCVRKGPESLSRVGSGRLDEPGVDGVSADVLDRGAEVLLAVDHPGSEARTPQMAVPTV